MLRSGRSAPSPSISRNTAGEGKRSRFGMNSFFRSGRSASPSDRQRSQYFRVGRANQATGMRNFFRSGRALPGRSMFFRTGRSDPKMVKMDHNYQNNNLVDGSFEFSKSGDQILNLLRSDRASEAINHLLRSGRSSDGFNHLLRSGRSSGDGFNHLLRSGRSALTSSDALNHLLRSGRSVGDGFNHLLRSGRSSPTDGFNHLLRSGRAVDGMNHLLRSGRSYPGFQDNDFLADENADTHQIADYELQQQQPTNSDYSQQQLNE